MSYSPRDQTPPPTSLNSQHCKCNRMHNGSPNIHSTPTRLRSSVAALNSPQAPPPSFDGFPNIPSTPTRLRSSIAPNTPQGLPPSFDSQHGECSRRNDPTCLRSLTAPFVTSHTSHTSPHTPRTSNDALSAQAHSQYTTSTSDVSSPTPTTDTMQTSCDSNSGRYVGLLDLQFDVMCRFTTAGEEEGVGDIGNTGRVQSPRHMGNTGRPQSPMGTPGHLHSSARYNLSHLGSRKPT